MKTAIEKIEAGSERRDARKQDEEGSSDEKTRQSGKAWYVADVALGASGLQTEQGFARLEPGMAVTIEIKTETRTILGFLLSPLKRMRNESFKER